MTTPQDLRLSTKITDTHAAVTKRIQDHKQQYFLELQVWCRGKNS